LDTTGFSWCASFEIRQKQKKAVLLKMKGFAGGEEWSTMKTGRKDRNHIPNQQDASLIKAQGAARKHRFFRKAHCLQGEMGRSFSRIIVVVYLRAMIRRRFLTEKRAEKGVNYV